MEAQEASTAKDLKDCPAIAGHGREIDFSCGGAASSEAPEIRQPNKHDMDHGIQSDVGLCSKLRGAASHKSKKSSDRRISLTYVEKADIVRYKRKHDKLTYEELGSWCEQRYGKRPSNAALCKLISKEAEQVLKYVENEGSRYNKNKAKLQRSPVDKIEAMLGAWFRDSAAAERQAPADSAIVERAKLIGAELGVLETQHFKYSPSWLLRFKKRLGIIECLPCSRPDHSRPPRCAPAGAPAGYSTDSDDARGAGDGCRRAGGERGGGSGGGGGGGGGALESGAICGS